MVVVQLKTNIASTWMSPIPSAHLKDHINDLPPSILIRILDEVLTNPVLDPKLPTSFTISDSNTQSPNVATSTSVAASLALTPISPVGANGSAAAGVTSPLAQSTTNANGIPTIVKPSGPVDPRQFPVFTLSQSDYSALNLAAIRVLTPFELSQTCHGWRVLVQTTPRLWRRIEVHSPTDCHLWRVERWMEAVGGPLDGKGKVQDLEVVLRQSDARTRRRRRRLSGGGNEDDTEDDEERASIKVLELLGRRVDRWKSLRVEFTGCGVRLTRILARLLGGLAKSLTLVDVSEHRTRIGTSANIGQDPQLPPQILSAISPRSGSTICRLEIVSLRFALFPRQPPPRRTDIFSPVFVVYGIWDALQALNSVKSLEWTADVRIRHSCTL